MAQEAVSHWSRTCMQRIIELKTGYDNEEELFVWQGQVHSCLTFTKKSYWLSSLQWKDTKILPGFIGRHTWRLKISIHLVHVPHCSIL